MESNQGDWFDQRRVEAGLVRILTEYQRLGFYTVEFKPAYEETAEDAAGEAGVIVHPNLNEGPQGRLTDVRFAFAAPAASARSGRASGHAIAGRPAVRAGDRASPIWMRSATLYANRGFRFGHRRRQGRVRRRMAARSR